MPNVPVTYRKIHVVNSSALTFDAQTEICEVPVAPPGRGEVLIRMAFAGIQASDTLQNSGQYGPLSEAEPEVEVDGRLQVGDCGCEGVGTIAAVGEGVELPVGTTVILSGFGVSFREYVTCPAYQAVPVPWPEDPAMTAIPISATTAACALDISGRLRDGEHVIVTGAAGGTGQFAVQWAKVKHNAYVVGTCGSAKKEQMLKEIGCDATINYREETNLRAAIKAVFPHGIDVAYESVCGPLRDAVWANMAVFGRMICIGSVADDYEKESALTVHRMASNSGLFKSLTCTSFYLGNLLGDPRLLQTLGEIMAYIRSGKMSVRLDPSSADFDGLEGVYEAQRYIRTGGNTGKIYVSFRP